MLVLAVNPCPCGYLGDADRACCCTPQRVQRYRMRLSGPLLDRIDLHQDVPRRSFTERAVLDPSPSSAEMRQQVLAARERQTHRFAGESRVNARMAPHEVARWCRVPESACGLLRATAEKLGWSRRTHDRVLRVARTLADMEGSEEISEDHLMEAVALRRASFEIAPLSAELGTALAS
jgi:magnesium chelatase family protein